MEGVAGERLFVISILELAVRDVIEAPAASIDEDVVYLIDTPDHDSRDAQLFLQKDNKAFRWYCLLLDLDPEYAYQKMWAKIKNKVMCNEEKAIRKAKELAEKIEREEAAKCAAKNKLRKERDRLRRAKKRAA
jgi:hypothetical protein